MAEMAALLVRACSVIGICLRTLKRWRKAFLGDGDGAERRKGSVSLPRFQGQCLESCFYTDPMKTNDHNECPVYATPLQR